MSLRTTITRGAPLGGFRYNFQQTRLEFARELSLEEGRCLMQATASIVSSMQDVLLSNVVSSHVGPDPAGYMSD
jgi:hypothetical protein